LDQFASVAHADAPLRTIVANAQGPASLGKRVKHSQLGGMADQGDCEQNSYECERPRITNGSRRWLHLHSGPPYAFTLYHILGGRPSAPYTRRTDQSSIGNSREQNAQSTMMMPFSLRISRRSSFGKRASTSSKCTTEQRHPRDSCARVCTRTSGSSWKSRHTSASGDSSASSSSSCRTVWARIAT